MQPISKVPYDLGRPSREVSERFLVHVQQRLVEFEKGLAGIEARQKDIVMRIFGPRPEDPASDTPPVNASDMENIRNMLDGIKIRIGAIDVLTGTLETL